MAALRDCETHDAPPVDDEPFWIEEEDIYSTYDTQSVFDKEILTPEEEILLKVHIAHVKNFDKRQHSRRFKKVELTLNVQVNPVPRPNRSSAYNTKYTYRSFVDNGLHLSAEDESVENTIAELFGSGEQTKPVSAVLPDFTVEEREILCVRLDLAEPVDGQPGWKAFANRIMDISNDDIVLFDECRCQYWYVIQVMELVLYHWTKLHRLRSPKCLLIPEKSSIKKVLVLMEKIDLIYKLKWNELLD